MKTSLIHNFWISSHRKRLGQYSGQYFYRRKQGRERTGKNIPFCPPCYSAACHLPVRVMLCGDQVTPPGG